MESVSRGRLAGDGVADDPCPQHRLLLHIRQDQIIGTWNSAGLACPTQAGSADVATLAFLPGATAILSAEAFADQRQHPVDADTHVE